MFTAQQMLGALIVGVVVGGAMGAAALYVLMVGPLERERETFRRRIVFFQLMAFSASTRATARAYALVGHPDVLDNDRWARNANGNGDQPAVLRSVTS